MPLLGARTGGAPELIRESDHDAVLFDYTSEALRGALLEALDGGGRIAAPSQSQAETRHWWSLFHARTGAVLANDETAEPTGADRVVAIIDGRSTTDLGTTLESLAALAAIHRVVALNPAAAHPPPSSP